MEEKKKKKRKMGCEASQVRFVGWKNYPRKWESWVENLSSTHQSTWKNAGIYDAIMVPKYPIRRHDYLILELASRWCSETNTFVFPWGEATLTLEDLMILGGFSASGVSTLCPPENDVVLLKIKECLELARKEIQSGKSRKAAQGQWLKKFMGSKNDIEHEAFLALFLSRFVFPVGPTKIINKHTFPIAIQLSRGIKVAIGPPVLGMLYKELSALKKRLIAMTSVSEMENNIGRLDLCAPFHLVQIWAWERFPSLRPIPNCMYSGTEFPKLARWSKVKILKDKDLRSAIDSAEEAFMWCPYGALGKHGGREDHESFAQCIMTSELVGFDCNEKYLPQRVARQFGLVQDIPTYHGDEITDQHTFKDVKLYASSRPVKPTVAGLYKKWWMQHPSNSSQVKVESGINYGVPPGFPPRIELMTIDDSDDDDDFSDEEDKLTRADPEDHPVSEIGSKNLLSPSFSDNESRESIFAIESANGALNGEHLLVIDFKMDESGKANKEPTSTSKSVRLKREDYDQDSVPCGFTSQVISIDDSSEDDDMAEDRCAKQEPTQKSVEDEGKCTGSIQGEVEDTGKASGFAEVSSSVPHNESATNFDAETYPNERFGDSYYNLEARISRLEKKVYAHIKKLQAAGNQ